MALRSAAPRVLAALRAATRRAYLTSFVDTKFQCHYRFVVLDDRAGLARFRGKQHVSRFSDRRCHGPALATKHCLQFARQLKIRRRTGQIDERLRASIPYGGHTLVTVQVPCQPRWR